MVTDCGCIRFGDELRQPINEQGKFTLQLMLTLHGIAPSKRGKPDAFGKSI